MRPELLLVNIRSNPSNTAKQHLLSSTMLGLTTRCGLLSSRSPQSPGSPATRLEVVVSKGAIFCFLMSCSNSVMVRCQSLIDLLVQLTLWVAGRAIGYALD
jgi:hypothetical protein